ncbi:hypothetical protein BC941DRAFT_408790 [Chlamydoabsidia padenii]|nr:hypothetical protein BC941DRAFT_408790 [Chlamydoabsidia padenii]
MKLTDTTIWINNGNVISKSNETMQHMVGWMLVYWIVTRVISPMVLVTATMMDWATAIPLLVLIITKNNTTFNLMGLWTLTTLPFDGHDPKEHVG